MKKLLKKYWIVPCAFIVVFAVVVACSIYKQTDSVTATLELSYEDASKSENPDGSHFSVLDFKSDSFLKRVMENLSSSDNEIDTDDVKQWFTVTPSGSYSDDYIATTYEISVDMPLRSGISATDLLNAISSAYQQQYEDQSTLNTDYLQIDSQYTDTLDYSDLYEYLLMKSKLFQDTLDECKKKSKIHNTWAETETYQSLSEEINNYQTFSLAWFQTYIEENRIYRDSAKEQRKLLYNRFSTYKKYVEQKNQYDYIVSLLDDYNIAMINPTMVPMYSETKKYFYMSLTRIGTDTLGEEAAVKETTLRNFRVKLHNLDLSIDRTDSTITKEEIVRIEVIDDEIATNAASGSDTTTNLFNDWDPNVQPNPGAPIKSGSTDEADAMLSEVCQQYNDLLARFEIIHAAEQEETFAHSFSIVTAEQSMTSKLSLKKALVFAFAASVLVLLFVSCRPKRTKKETEV